MHYIMEHNHQKSQTAIIARELPTGKRQIAEDYYTSDAKKAKKRPDIKSDLNLHKKEREI